MCVSALFSTATTQDCWFQHLFSLFWVPYRHTHYIYVWWVWCLLVYESGLITGQFSARHPKMTESQRKKRAHTPSQPKQCGDFYSKHCEKIKKQRYESDESLTLLLISSLVKYFKHKHRELKRESVAITVKRKHKKLEALKAQDLTATCQRTKTTSWCRDKERVWETTDSLQLFPPLCSHCSAFPAD